MTLRIGGVVVAAAVLALTPPLQPRLDAQLPSMSDDRLAGLQWRFVRIRYHYVTEGTSVSQEFYGEPWAIDAPAAEQNLSRRVKTATAIQVEDPITIALDDPRLLGVIVNLYSNPVGAAANELTIWGVR